MTGVLTTEILVLAHAKASPGKESALEAALLEVAGPTLAQPGCLRFELYRSAQDAAVITAIERWASSDDHQRHIQGDHVKRLMTRFDGILAAPPEIVVMKPL
jgi:quinol monooxygenase YgiN